MLGFLTPHRRDVQNRTLTTPKETGAAALRAAPGRAGLIQGGREERPAGGECSRVDAGAGASPHSPPTPVTGVSPSTPSFRLDGNVFCLVLTLAHGADQSLQRPASARHRQQVDA